jgi:hypothetical protein
MKIKTNVLRNAPLSAWLSGKSKAPIQPKAPKNAKLIKTRADLTPFQGIR